MEFSWWAAIITVFTMLAEALLSIWEGTFSRRSGLRLRMPFLWNWAVSVGGLVILPIVNAIVISKLRWGLPLYIFSFLIGVFMTWALYFMWWVQGNENKGHILYWEIEKAARWTKNVTVAGWLHFFYMVIEIMILVIYINSPMSRSVVLTVSGLFLIYIVIVNVQAKVVQHSFSYKVILGELIALGLTIMVRL